MRLISSIAALILISACQSHHSVEFGSSSATIKDVTPQVSKTEVIGWQVGKAKKAGVTRGVRISFELPTISKKDGERLKKEFGFNGWLIKFERISGERSESLGNFYLQIFSNKGGSFKDMQASKATLNLHYAASAISARMDRLSCPELNHRFKIDEVDISDYRGSLTKNISISKSSYQNKVFSPEKLNFSAYKINGGSRLEGEYRLSLMAYDSQRNQILSNNIFYQNLVVVKKERKISLSGCPFNSQGSPQKEKEQTFKFGR